MMSKWQFISWWCWSKGYPKPAKLAFEIEKSLRNLYGNTITPEWEKDFKTLKREFASLDPVDFLFDIVNETEYCIACVTHNTNCKICKFAEIHGKCKYLTSLHGVFISNFHKYFNI